MKEACPDGIDGYFENVGGVIVDAVLLHSNSFARVALCGMISRYDGHPIPITPTQHILMHRMRLEAFVITEHMEVWPDVLKELGALVATGKLKYRETVSQDLDTAPEALIGPVHGQELRQATRQARLKPGNGWRNLILHPLPCRPPAPRMTSAAPTVRSPRCSF